MTDKQLAPKVRAWLKATDVGPEDVRRSVGIVSGRATDIRQRRRWTLLPIFRARRSPRPIVTEVQPSPTSATNGHIPTVIGSTQTMLSPAKAITAGAIVFAVGGAMLISQPWGEQGDGLPGAVTDEPRFAPVEVTGTIICGPAVRTGTSELTVVELADGRMPISKNRGDAWQQTATMSDPRLTGTYYTSEDTDEYRLGGTSGVSVATYTRRIENDDGAWQGSDTYAYLSDGSITALSTVLVGEGAYEGLRVVWEELWEQSSGAPFCSAEVRGVIIEGDVPPAAEPFIGP